MRKPIRDGALRIIGWYDTWSDARHYLLTNGGVRLGTYEVDRDVTRDQHGKIIGRGNQLMRLLAE